MVPRTIFLYIDEEDTQHLTPCFWPVLIGSVDVYANDDATSLWNRIKATYTEAWCVLEGGDLEPEKLIPFGLIFIDQRGDSAVCVDGTPKTLWPYLQDNPDARTELVFLEGIRGRKRWLAWSEAGSSKEVGVLL